MKGIPQFSRKYFLQFRDTPIKLKPFNPKTKKIAQKYVNKIAKKIANKSVIVKLRGSTLFEVLGKGDIDIGIYTDKNSYIPTVNKLKSFFNEPLASGKNFTSFKTKDGIYDIDISLMKGNEAKVDLKLTDYLLKNTKFLKEYELLKKKYSYSKREYVFQRDAFLRNIIKSIN